MTVTFQSEDEAIAAIQAHPVCAQFIATPINYAVFYPDAYVVPGGASVPRGLRALDSLIQLYVTIDRFWQAQRLQIPSA